jgi:SET domain-containing protein
LSWLTKVAFGPSTVHGIGVFALEPIRRGTKVWTVDSTMMFMGPSELLALSRDELRFALNGGYLHFPSGRFVYYNDGMEYVNHASGISANIGICEWTPLQEDNCTALRDIKPGEELLEDYSFWSILQLRSNHWLVDLYRQFSPEHYDFLLQIEREHIRKSA